MNCIYTIHNVFTSGKISRYYHIGLRKIAQKIYRVKIHSISDSVYNNELNYYKTNTIKIYNWYNAIRFYPRTTQEYKAAREKLTIAENLTTLISIGGCSSIKQHEDIIKAMHLLNKKGIQFYYLHIGEGHTLNDEIKMAKAFSLENQILFLGNQNEVKKYLDAADLYIMPSKFEGISLTTIEAMAVKVPTLLYDVPGLQDFNSDTEITTTLIPPNTESLATALEHFYLCKKQNHALIDAAFDHVNYRYNMNKNALLIYNLYTCQ